MMAMMEIGFGNKLPVLADADDSDVGVD